MNHGFAATPERLQRASLMADVWDCIWAHVDMAVGDDFPCRALIERLENGLQAALDDQEDAWGAMWDVLQDGWDFTSSAAAILDLLPNREICIVAVTIATGGAASLPALAACSAADLVIGGVAAVTTQVNIIQACGWTWTTAKLTAGNIGNFLAEGLDPESEFIVEYLILDQTNSQIAHCREARS